MQPTAHEPHIVPDLLQKDLKLVFCGTAPSAISAQRKAYYAKPGNQFWPVLYRIDLTPHQLSPQDYPKLLEYGIGLTDICKSQSGQDSDLDFTQFDKTAFEQKIRHFSPKMLAFTSKNAAQTYLGHKTNYGPQTKTIADTQLFVLPSTSGLAIRWWREEIWEALAASLMSSEEQQAHRVAQSSKSIG